MLDTNLRYDVLLVTFLTQRCHGRRHVSHMQYCRFFPQRIEELFEDTI